MYCLLIRHLILVPTMLLLSRTKNVLMQSKSAKTNPLLLGPILVHQSKTFHAFYYLASTLVRLKPCLKKIKAFGTDVESELIKVFQCVFPDAVHLRCTYHLRKNVKDKLNVLGMQGACMKPIMGDIFGAQFGSHFDKGLVDAANANEEEFCSQLEKKVEQLGNEFKSLLGGASIPHLVCELQSTSDSFICTSRSTKEGPDLW